MFESVSFEQDPSYDPELLEGDGEEVEPTPENNLRSAPLIIYVSCPEYHVMSENPYRYDANPPRALDDIASVIEAPIRQRFSGRDILLRGVQSAHFGAANRQQLIEQIVEKGGDMFLSQPTDPTYDMHARRCENYGGAEMLKLLQSFHTYKPKCDELPLTPVDIWQVFAADSYDEVEYMHPRHNVLARDRYKLRPGIDPRDALLAIVVVN